MLYDFADIIDPEELPKKLSDLKWHITGFVDGDGGFPIILSPDPNKKFGWLIQPRFEIELIRSKDSLTMLRTVCRAMTITPKILGDTAVKLVVTNRRLLREKVIPFFNRYRPVLKWQEFNLMREVCENLEAGKHLEHEWFKAIIKKIYMLPADGETRRKWSFRDILPNEEVPPRGERVTGRFPSGIVALKHYAAGFTDAEGCFGYAVNKQTQSITPYLTVTSTNREVLTRLRQILECGEIAGGRLQVYGVENMTKKIIPFFDRQKLIAKKTTYQKFKQILQKITDKEHEINFKQVEEMVEDLNKPAGRPPETIRRAPL